MPKFASHSWGAKGLIMTYITLACLGLMLMACQDQTFNRPSDTTASDVRTLNAVRCRLDARANTIFPGMSPFTLLRVSAQNEPLKVAFRSQAKSTVGVGQQNTDGSWHVNTWLTRDAIPPMLGQMVLSSDKRIVVSARSIATEHETFEGHCDVVTHKTGFGGE